MLGVWSLTVMILELCLVKLDYWATFESVDFAHFRNITAPALSLYNPGSNPALNNRVSGLISLINSSFVLITEDSAVWHSWQSASRNDAQV